MGEISWASHVTKDILANRSDAQIIPEKRKPLAERWGAATTPG